MDKMRIAIIGLGYVGLPLARLFATKYSVVGFDVKQERVSALSLGEDTTKEVSEESLKSVLSDHLPEEGETGLYFTSDPEDLVSCNYYVVAVPTPVDTHHSPDLTPLYRASETVGKVLKKGDIVIYESTVCPGITEEECVPILAKTSGLVYNEDFFAGYSPERINPGDKEHTVEKIMKVTSGSTPDAAEKVDALYRSVITAGTFPVSSIRVAEASKVIENTQRDINIAFVNELSKIFHLLDIDTNEVLAAAGTKWNFLPFRPGLVGGHCIGVDPYYLIRKAQDYGYHPGLILYGRRINDTMGEYIANRVVKCMIKKDVPVKNAEVLVLGFTFKENCPDVRNTKVGDVVRVLKDYGINVSVYDPWARAEEVRDEYGIELTGSLSKGRKYDVIVLAVAHKEFLELDIPSLVSENHVVYDVKGCLNPEWVDDRL
ncbi:MULTISPECIES: nucleotide sugar dehydrogenase [Parabacteroides]|uniref:Nucleotide sugar dehydrogenase n=5 Tax=Bacteroidales TaxID=171549 RepID=A0A6G1Z9M3_9BACT|nr:MULTISPECIES: nucleotide sugar dehydrogenase [Parabacteroides]EOS16275.1 nucleotide sugar dehydrogenase [Parabacteroides goldsteinii dnLKV18]MBF0764362.1 nucleotide sugar dehydrogenase [Parabacteroides goldsteinii]MDZ3925383.1 nucleotide sugar dehydrogenase [Parabacteroides goldsteinii]MRX91137.1 nucleotide sugar dehydrogenase [Parabacteroides goldsteinii]MRX96265.1 nucleotide sugar dehydrogenase [Parabacteroides goldsteinii]